MENHTKSAPAIPEEKSYFDGGYFAYMGYNLLVFWVTLLTLGIAYPWMCCVKQRWKAKHTVICGKRMVFDGTGAQLIGNYLLWYLLSLITCGIYSFWMTIAMKKWIAKHTHFVGEEDNNSYFDGGLGGLIGTNILSTLVLAVPVVGFAWSNIIKLRWETRHTVTDSRRLLFVGTVGNLFVKYLLWGLLTMITFGIFAWFMPVKLMRWETENTIDNEHTTEELIKRSEYRSMVHTDAAGIKTMAVENEMEGVKAGIPDAMSAEDLLALAQRGVRAAQYAYVQRCANGQYTQEPYSSLLLSAAQAEFAPAVCLYAQTHAMEETVKKEWLAKAADKGQVPAIRACLVDTATAALALPETPQALPELRRAVRYADLLVDSDHELTENEAALAKECVLRVRRITSAIYTAGGGKVVAIVLAVVLGLPILVGLIAGGIMLLSRSPMMSAPSLQGGFADENKVVASTVLHDRFWTPFSEEMEDEYYEFATISADDDEVAYELTCDHWYWESRYTLEVTKKDDYLACLRLYGDRVLDENAPDPTINETEMITTARKIYKYLGLGDYEDFVPYTADGAHTDVCGEWQFVYDNTDTHFSLTVKPVVATDNAQGGDFAADVVAVAR